MTIDQFSRAFQEAIADGQTDSVLSLGEAWAMKDAPSLLDQL